MGEDYIRNLESIIKQMLRPLKDIPLSLVIESISGHKITPFNINDQKDKALLSDLIKVARFAGLNVNKSGILRPRPNEVGNDIEPFVKDSLRHYGYAADIPITKGGDKKAAGYPDIEFVDKFKRTNYLECKTYNKENVSTTQRSFYLSPSEDFKVTNDAHHFILSFETYVDGRVGNNNLYRCKTWKILSIGNLLVDVKYEFQSDNRRLYSKEMVIAEEELPVST
jgi:hypothetical protein